MDMLNLESNQIEFVGIANKGKSLVAVFRRTNPLFSKPIELFALTKSEVNRKISSLSRIGADYSETLRAKAAFDIK